MEAPLNRKPSPNETLKENSNFLRGTIKESLAADTTHFTGDEGNLLKHHGTYQQDDRDIRQKLLKEKKEPAYSMMVRSKIVGGIMNADQYLIHDELADRYGNGTIRITTRQGFQFHGVLKKNLKAVIKGIYSKLGTTQGACGDVVRNVMACPAPIHSRRRMEIFKYAKALSDQFLPRGGAYQEIWLNGEKVEAPKPAQENPEPIYGKTYLPRKFKIGIAFPEDNCVDIYTHDLGFVPEIKNETLQGFHVLVGGGFGMTHGVKTTYPRLASPLCFVKPEDVLEIAKAVVLVQRDFGNRSDRKRARLKYTIDDRGLEWFRAEVEKRFGKKTEDPRPIAWKHIENHLGWNEQGDGKWFLGMPIENGRIKDELAGVRPATGSPAGQWRHAVPLRLKSGLRALVEKFRPGIALTPQQDILFYDLQSAQKAEIEKLLTSYGIKLPNQVSNLRKDAMACPALPTCGLAISESERVLPSIIDQLEKKIEALGLADQRIMIRMTGCPNGCARPYNAEIAFVGKTAGTYNIYVGGSLTGNRMNKVYAEKVLQQDLAKSIEPLFDLYIKERQSGELFGDFCHRLGIEKLALSREIR